ncbi:unnamed protein product, partial [Ectocarpus sp. 6 AP-2014]
MASGSVRSGVLQRYSAVTTVDEAGRRTQGSAAGARRRAQGATTRARAGADPSSYGGKGEKNRYGKEPDMVATWYRNAVKVISKSPVIISPRHHDTQAYNSSVHSVGCLLCSDTYIFTPPGVAIPNSELHTSCALRTH